MARNSIAIGIDLGTTNSCVGVCLNGKVEIVQNDSGKRTTPSVVAFTDTGCIIGDGAKLQAFRNPENTIFGVKRIIGRKLDESLLSDMKLLPFKVFCGGDKCKIAVTYRNEARILTPEEISAKILAKLKEAAETYLECEVTDAVITVPAYFNDSQRNATIDAGRIAGLNVLRIINEPTAAALAYAWGKKISEDRNVLVFDLGGGTFDVSIVTVRNGDFKVRAVSGDTHLGGEDIDNRLMVYIIKEFQRKFNKNPLTDSKALSRMKTYCENAKMELSSKQIARIRIDALCDGIDYCTTITRSRFEEINSNLFALALKTVEKALHDAGMNKTDIHDVVLVGGSTRIPKIRSLLEEYFDGKKPNQGINPDEAVAYGAAIQAALLKDGLSPGLRDLHLSDVVSWSLGIETEGGAAHPLIKRNTPIPTKHTQTFPTCEDNQNHVGINVYEGEEEMFKDNNNLGSFILEELPDAPKGAVKLDVTFEVTENGTLTVSATEKDGRATNKITIRTNQGRLSEQEIQRMTQEAKRNREEDKRQHECDVKKVGFEEYIGTIESDIASNNNMGEKEKTLLLRLCKEASTWLEQPHTLEEYTTKHMQLRQMFDLLEKK